jgi:ABC-type proline/glycine betaine transport system permease subunit
VLNISLSLFVNVVLYIIQPLTDLTETMPVFVFVVVSVPGRTVNEN